MINLNEALGYLGLVWGVACACVQGVGIWKLFRSYSSIPAKPISPSLPKDEIPHITIIRPAKGLEPGLYECLAATFQQDYPRDRLTIFFCASSRRDPAFPTLERLVADHPDFDAHVLVEEEDPVLQADAIPNMGPNPKIRNTSRAYRQARPDSLIWALDCNVWVAASTAGRMVDKLCGFAPGGARRQPYKFAHHLPLVVDTVTSMSHTDARGHSQLAGAAVTGGSSAATAVDVPTSPWQRALAHGGGRLEEMFMATTHAKFYGAINTVGVAPCVVGKSNMYRKAHIEHVTDARRNLLLQKQPQTQHTLPTGIDYFSAFLCEDHVIGDLLWRSELPGAAYANHGLVPGDLVVQPMAGMSITAYAARRVRWLRARKWTVLAATLVEHGVESLVCSAYFSYGLTTVGPASRTWSAFAACWLACVTLWMVVDRRVFVKLHAGQSIDVGGAHTPPFVRGATSSRIGGVSGQVEKRPFGQWLLAWLGREFLALPIWTWAVFLGTGVSWRGEQFRVRSDMTVEPAGGKSSHEGANGKLNGQAAGKMD